MDFLKEIEPYKEYVDLYLNKNCMPSYSVRLKMSKVYDDLRKDKRVQIYGTVDHDIRPIEQGCSPCIKRMMIDLRNWIKLETDLAQEKLTEFKGVPQREENPMPDDMLSEAVESIPSVKSYDTSNLEKYVDPNLSPYEKTLYPKMKWGEFKTYCREQGLNVNKKKRVDLEKELKDL
jgi:hypothetical protein